ncbi:hypothetical protein APR04_000207 [Promicromonospora umidemergens]|uniref:Uncharacterized protein n=1 Tax=Promicromonospora umidemergens TaxID=629679 RepID=A0ABP8X9Q1_9MICO|nr:hypothetical protein [Promicromonospora umidemergens]
MSVHKKTRSGRRPRPNEAFPVGSHLTVPFGVRRYNATVIERYGDRVRIQIEVPGADEPITSSYSVADLARSA